MFHESLVLFWGLVATIYLYTVLTDSQVADQISSAKPAAIRHKQSASPIDGSASKQPAAMSSNFQVSLQCIAKLGDCYSCDHVTCDNVT